MSRPPRLVLLLLLLGAVAGALGSLGAQPTTSPPMSEVATDAYSLPRRMLPLEGALQRLVEAGAPLAYRPDQLPQLALRVPGGRRPLAEWLAFLLDATDLTFEANGATGGYLILPDTELLNRAAILSGTVTDGRTGERLIGAAVYLPDRASGVVSDDFGRYSAPTTGGRQRLRISYIGYRPFETEFTLRGDSSLNVALVPNPSLPQVIVTALPDSAGVAHYTETGLRIGGEEVNQLSGPGGQADPLRLARLLPGVTSGADGVGGLFIRGSDAGHNLVLLDGVPVFNLNHAAGLFSIFNNDAIQRVELYKDAVPARFGGRIGGVLDVHTRDGNTYATEASAGINLLAANLTAEGPLDDGRGSFLLTSRYFWASPVLREYSRRYKERRGRTGSASYDVYDINFKLNQQLGTRGRAYFSFYKGVDDYANRTFQTDTFNVLTDAGAVFRYGKPRRNINEISWANTVGALRYSHTFSNRLFGNFRLSYSDLTTRTAFERSDSTIVLAPEVTATGSTFSGRYSSDVRQVGLGFDGRYSLSAMGVLRFGGGVDFHRFDPQFSSGHSQLEDYPPARREVAEMDRPRLFYTYGDLSGRLRPGLNYRIGLRAQYWANQTNYVSLSPRVLLAGPLTPTLDWRVSYDRSVQQIHLLGSTILELPSDTYVPAGPRVSPSTSDQLAGRLLHQPRSGRYAFELGVYHRTLNDLVNYQEGGVIDGDWTDKLSLGRGTAYGSELTVRRVRGRVRGWLSYTLARSDRRFDDRINLGNTFAFRYDRRHAINAFVIWQLRPAMTLSASWRYGTGAAYSLSLENIRIVDPELVRSEDEPLEINLTSARNNFRLPANHRLDLNLPTEISRPGRAISHAFDVGIYNVYDRHNPLYYEARTEYTAGAGAPEGIRRFYQIYVAPLLPVLSYKVSYRGR